jgi:uncharacterized membrane protein
LCLHHDAIARSIDERSLPQCFSNGGLGFFIGTVVCYIVCGITGDTTFWPKMAVMLMIFGIIGALVAALFGFIDYFTARMSDGVKATGRTTCCSILPSS